MYKTNIWGIDILIEGYKDVFSPNSLDLGTKTMLSKIELSENDKVLDIGCGTGVVGIAVAKKIGQDNVVMSDVDSNAIKCSQDNLIRNDVPNVKIIQSDGFDEIQDSIFSYILSNPPYHTNFSVAKDFIESGKKHLTVNGKMVLVVKRLDWYKNKMKSVFGGVKVIEENGYYILISEKRDVKHRSKQKTKTTSKKHLKKVAASNKKISKKKKS